MESFTDDQRTRSKRSDAVSSLRTAGLSKKFPIDSSMELTDFQKYLESAAGGGLTLEDARSRTNVVSRFSFFCDSSRLCTIHWSNSRSMALYIEAVRKHSLAKASTIRGYIHSLRLVSNFVDHAKMPRIETSSVVKDSIATLLQAHRRLQRRREDYIHSTVLLRLSDNAHRLICHDAFEKMDSYLPQVERLMHDSSVAGLDSQTKNTVTSYFCGYIALLNVSRPSHVTYFSLDEFRAATFQDGFHLSVTSNAKSGCAALVLSSRLYSAVQRYILHVRSSIQGASLAGAAAVFVNTQGKRLKNLSSARHLYKVYRLAGVESPHVPSLTEVRMVISTVAARHLSDHPGELASLNSYLAHSQATARRYYVAGASELEFRVGYAIVARIRGQLVGGVPAPAAPPPTPTPTAGPPPPPVPAPAPQQPVVLLRQCSVLLQRLP